jgi:phosphatidylinositol glycan class W
VDYQHHASEYGASWNFFLTLATLRMLALLAPGALRSGGVAAAVGGGALAAHQWGLSAGGLIEVVHSDERSGGWLVANKEGLLSLPGYWALQLLGTAAGHAAHRLATAAAAATAAAQQAGSSRGGGLTIRLHAGQPPPRGPALHLLAGLASGVAALWLAYWLVAAGVQPVSRRACNAAYVLWMLALNLQCLLLFLAADIALPGTPPRLLSAVSVAMMPLFLAANLLTGAVNLAFNTLAASRTAALALVTAYMASLCGGVVAIMERRAKRE